MKKTILSISIILATAIATLAQTGINYQAVVRNSSGTVLPNETVTANFEIKDGGTTIWSETHTNATTDDNGILQLVIGEENNGTGDFNTIGWNMTDPRLRVELTVNSETLLSEEKLNNVPYALYSETAVNVINDAVDDADNDASNEIQSLSLSGGTLSISTSGQSSVDMPWTETGSVIHQTNTNKSVSIGTTQVTSSPNVDLMVEGFTQLGGDNTPGIKTKWIDQYDIEGTSTVIPIGVDASVILSVSVHVNAGGQLIPPNGDSWDQGDTYAYNYDISGSQLRIRTNPNASTNNLINQPVQIYIIHRSN